MHSNHDTIYCTAHRICRRTSVRAGVAPVLLRRILAHRILAHPRPWASTGSSHRRPHARHQPAAMVGGRWLGVPGAVPRAPDGERRGWRRAGGCMAGGAMTKTRSSSSKQRRPPRRTTCCKKTTQPPAQQEGHQEKTNVLRTSTRARPGGAEQPAVRTSTRAPKWS